MKKSIIAFGILFSVLATANANVNPRVDNIRTINTKTKNVAPISLAVAQNDYYTVKRFIELGADIEVKEKTIGMTPLMYAARYNNVKLLKLLVDNGASLEEKSKLDMNALDYAKLSNATDAVAFLETL